MRQQMHCWVITDHNLWPFLPYLTPWGKISENFALEAIYFLGRLALLTDYSHSRILSFMEKYALIRIHGEIYLNQKIFAYYIPKYTRHFTCIGKPEFDVLKISHTFIKPLLKISLISQSSYFAHSVWHVCVIWLLSFFI